MTNQFEKSLFLFLDPISAFSSHGNPTIATIAHILRPLFEKKWNPSPLELLNLNQLLKHVILLFGPMSFLMLFLVLMKPFELLNQCLFIELFENLLHFYFSLSLRH